MSWKDHKYYTEERSVTNVETQICHKISSSLLIVDAILCSTDSRFFFPHTDTPNLNQFAKLMAFFKEDFRRVWEICFLRDTLYHTMGPTRKCVFFSLASIVLKRRCPKQQQNREKNIFGNNIFYLLRHSSYTLPTVKVWS